MKYVENFFILTDVSANDSFYCIVFYNRGLLLTRDYCWPVIPVYIYSLSYLLAPEELHSEQGEDENEEEEKE